MPPRPRVQACDALLAALAAPETAAAVAGVLRSARSAAVRTERHVAKQPRGGPLLSLFGCGRVTL